MAPHPMCTLRQAGVLGNPKYCLGDGIGGRWGEYEVYEWALFAILGACARSLAQANAMVRPSKGAVVMCW